MSLVLPKSTLNLLDNVSVASRHPGLQLDKLSEPGDQTAQKRALENVVSACNTVSPHATEYTQLRKRWLAATDAVGASTFSAITIGPLTLHLARASALENAGICLHPLYGFTYLPGSGLKGMARAYAETVWLQAQTDEKQAWRHIEDVFGWAPCSDKGKGWKPDDIPQREKTEAARVGNIVFHEAWPETWPELIVDIVNNHHADYYRHDDNQHAPGDWENPIPVYFLAVKPEASFSFPLAKRRADVPNKLLDLARQWLLGSLCHLGSGAKTAAGYGVFRPADADTPTLPSQSRAVFETTLELVTPAFLAGANQQAEDCDLRSATLRGLLRWWWRTMHAGFLDVKTLRALEAAIWGDTKGGGAVRIELSPKTRGTKTLHSHPRVRNSGIRYVAYGMDEKRKGHRKQRYRLNPPATWNVRLIARPTRFGADMDDPKSERQPASFSAGQVLEQAKAALWLLCNYGGIGSKSRKGFGSLISKQDDFTDLEQCQRIASNVRQDCSIDCVFSTNLAASPSISDPDVQSAEIIVKTSSPDDVIERIGRAYAAVASRFKHNADQEGSVQSPNKAAWGLPRKIHGPLDLPLQHQSTDSHKRPEWLESPKRPPDVSPPNARHGSPIHIHVDAESSGNFRVRILAMPAMYLTNRDESIEMVRIFREAFIANFDTSPAQTSTASGGTSTTSRRSTAPTGKRPSGTAARVRIVGERPKGGYEVQEQGYRQGTLTVGTPAETPPGIGDEVDVAVHNDDSKRPQYRWINPNEKGKGKPKGDRGGKRGRGRR